MNLKRHAITGDPCHWCGRPMTTRSDDLFPTKDHVLSIIQSGFDEQMTVWSCRCCNALKGEMSPSQWEETRNKFGAEYWRQYREQSLRGVIFYVRRVLE